MKQDLSQEYLDIAGVMFVGLNAQGQITLINKKGCSILGYNNERELLGKNWFDRCLPAHHRDEVKRIFQKIMNGEMASVEYYENPVLTKSGEQRFISWHNTVLRDNKNHPLGTLSSGLDITERKQIEESLRESEARIRAIVETAVDGILTINERGIIESANSAIERLFGYKVEEVVGKSVSILMPPPHRLEHDHYIVNYLRSGEKKIIGVGREVMAQRKDGTLFPIHLSVSEFFLGNRRMFTGILHDLSEQKILQQQILQAERLAIIGKMAAKVAHEIRNPLSSISLNAELLQDELQSYQSIDTSESLSLLTAMIREIDRVSVLTDEYLQFSRLPESHPVIEQVDTLIDELRDLLVAELKQKNIEFEFKASRPPLKVRLDRSQFRRVLLNIIRNAIEAMPKGGTLTIWTEQIDRKAVLNIKDTGVGISEDMRERIFDPFFTTKDFGTGLGLAVTQQVINEHGGQITCSSQVGKGTTFTIELPLEKTN